jgi:cell division protein FtsQ
VKVASPRQRSEDSERRLQLRRRKRFDLLARIWRLLALIGASIGLGWVVLSQGWVLHSPNQVQVSGAPDINREQVIRAGGLQFPLPLLQLDPSQLKQRLAAALPVDQVRLQRQMLPPRLSIQLHQREAVARAQRLASAGPEQGFVDRTGRWISPRQQAGNTKAKLPPLTVMGWQPRYISSIELLLAGLPPQLAITQIRFQPDGELWVVSSSLGPVRFGPIDDRLPRRIQVLAHLAKQWQPTRSKALDLSDPEHPELALDKPPPR